MRSGLIKEATLVGGSLFVVGAALMQFRRDGITDKQYWPYLGVFITGFSAHLIFEAFGLNKKYCETAFQSEVKEEWGEEVEWDEDADEKGKPDWRQDVEWDAESKDEARMKKYEKTYGKEGAKVRNRIFKRILAKAQDGTKASQWSARKAQSLTESYEKAMKRKGKTAYKGGKKTKSQKSLKKWGDQKWTTKSGKKSSKTGERYLPEKAIKALSDKEYKETSDKKRKDTKKGKQFSKQPKKVADKVKKYRADGYGSGTYYGSGGNLKRPSKWARAKAGWSKQDEATWKSKQQEPKEITEFEKEMIWVENMFNQNRYYCKRYEDIPYLQRKTFSGKNLRRGNRCYNCRSKECPSTLLSWKQAHRLADEADDRRAKKWGIRDDLIESGEYPEYLRRDRDSILKDLFGAEGDIPYGVHVQNYKTTSTVFYKRKPFRKYRGNRHREQAQAYASFMESKLKRNPRYFNYYAESFEAEDEPQAYLMCDWNKKVPYEIHNAGCKHRNFYEKRWESDIDLWNPTSLEGVCRDYIQVWEHNLESADYVDGEDLDAIAKMTFSQFMRNDYTKTTTPIKLSPCHRDNPKIKQFMDNTLVGDISPLTYLRYGAEEFEASSSRTIIPTKYYKPSTGKMRQFTGTCPKPNCNNRAVFQVIGADKRGEQRHYHCVNNAGKWIHTGRFRKRVRTWDKPSNENYTQWAEDESFEAEGKPTSVEVKRSTNDEKKLMAVFTYPDERTQTTHFGQRGASDYTKHGEKERMERYLERHGGGTTTSTKEDWKDPTTAGALSRWILWNKPSLSASFNDFKKRFNLKGELKVSKSAESFESETVAFESFRGRWNVGQTRDIEGVRVKKMRNGAFKLDFQGESIIIYDGQFYQINRNGRGGFSMGRYDSALNGELLRSGYSEKDIPDNMEAIIRWKHRVGGGRLVIRSPFKKARHIFAGGLYHFTLPGQGYGGVFYPTNQGKTYRFIRRNGEPIVGRFPKKNEAWLDIRYDAESFEAQFTPSQELSDYTPEEIVESSAIDGFQPSKFSVMGNRAETFAADSCRECGRKEGPYSDTVLIACKGCPELSCQHCLDEENNGCAFCIKKRAESTSKGLNLVMMGVPGSGKGTQSKLITKAYGWPQIGMGDLIRDNMRKKTPLGVKCEPYMAKGSLVPDEIMIELVSQRLKEDDCKNGFILDGFPRTVPQGKALEKITNIDAVFFLDTKKEVVIERLGGRRTCSDCGEIFHQLFQPPQQEGTCDLCKGELFIRPDDNPKTISNRLSVFKTKTQPLIDFYEQRNILRPIQSNSTPQDVFESIDGDIQSMLVSGDITALEAQDTPYCNYHTQLVLGAETALILGAEHYTGGRPMTCPVCIQTLSEY